MKVTQITIDFEDCKEEVNSPKVLRDWKANGPMYMIPGGENIRVPRSGHRVEFTGSKGLEAYEFTLHGFGKLDKKEALHLNENATNALKLFMGNAWGLVNLSHKQEAERKIREIGLEEFVRQLKRNYTPGDGRLSALNKTINGTSVDESTQDNPKDVLLTDQQLKDMGLM